MSATTISDVGTVTLSIKINRTIIPDGLRVLSVGIQTAINRILSARIVLSDGHPDTVSLATIHPLHFYQTPRGVINKIKSLCLIMF